MTKNQVMLYKLLVNFPNDHQNNLAEAMSIQRSLMTYGYMLDENAFNQLKATDLSNAVAFNTECEEIMKNLMGGKHSYQSLYKNFPNDVLSMTHAELFYNRILHYYGVKNFGEYGEEKDAMFEQVNYKMIKGTDENGIMKVYEILAGSGQSLTPLDIKVLKYFTTVKDLPIVTVPFKENLAVLASNVKGFKVQTVVDVLRIAVAMSGGDPSLPAIPKKLKVQGPKWAEREKERAAFKFKLDPHQIARVMDLFENSNLSTSDMNQGSRYGRFIRLAEVLRVQDWKDTFPKTFEAFNRLRNQKRKGKPQGQPKIRTWQSQVESQFKIGFADGLLKLSERPGEFVRKLDLLVRKNISNKANMFSILSTLANVAEKTSNKVLFEVFTHFSERDKFVARSIFIKGARNKTQLPSLDPLPKDIIQSVKDTVLNAIKYKISSLPSLGKVYIDPLLENIPLPTNMRSLSESLTPVIRGQANPIEDKAVIRAFVHWFDPNGREDLDLHGYIYKDGFTNPASMGFNGVQKASYGCYSGDVRYRKGACAEYIDINIAGLKKDGYRYFTPMVKNYENRSLKSMQDTVVGFEYRENASANDTWLPETIANAMKPSSEATSIIMGVFDIQEMTYTHLDLDWNGLGGQGHYELGTVIKSFAGKPEISVYDLLKWHAEERGMSASLDVAETHFMFDDFRHDYTAILPWMGI